MPRQSLLLVDDHQANLDSLALAFARSDYDVATALGGPRALQMMNDRCFDVIVTDLKMPKVDGLEIVQRARSLNPPSAVIVITAHGSIPTAVQALRDGAVDYLTKPVDMFELRHHVAASMEKQKLARENLFLHEELRQRYGLENMIGDSNAMREVFEQTRRAAASRATALIQGESGTGKELIARALHNLGPYSRHPFIAVHCAALSESLIESELFGHERGAYTGAEAGRPGRFEMAGSGTIFLDEVAEIPPQTQVKLLRVLENREFQRVGGVQTLRSEARVIAAANRNLEAEVKAGRLREDLFYRLSVITIRVPPLREREGDIALLLRAFLQEFSGDAPTRLSREAYECLEAYSWPGNVRELRNTVERVCVMRRGGVVHVGDLPEAITGTHSGNNTVRIQVGMKLDDIERTMIEETLKSAGGNRTAAARQLGISRRTLQRKLGETSLDKDDEG
ncbi:MAG: sigma-54 dependent transcriptional regulator [Candidatus Sumerlaeota bacterium]|nr:sigma-54 dependent transcriptional regulator [Candidatus Sumerlaeota bacterium]